MSKIYRFLFRTFLIFLLVLPIACFAHYILFPQESQSLLIKWSGFTEDKNVFYHPRTSPATIDSLKRMIAAASARVKGLFDSKQSHPTIIYCQDASNYHRYSVTPSAPAVTYLKFHGTIVLSGEGFNVDILAHEITHVELRERIGYFAFNHRIPSWFKHGLAMQNDYRRHYCINTFLVKMEQGVYVPTIDHLQTDDQFYSGTTEEIMLHYMAAKYAIAQWYTSKKLNRLIDDLNQGRDFESSFKK